MTHPGKPRHTRKFNVFYCVVEQSNYYWTLRTVGFVQNLWKPDSPAVAGKSACRGAGPIHSDKSRSCPIKLLALGGPRQVAVLAVGSLKKGILSFSKAVNSDNHF